MRRILVTGANGFTGRYLGPLLASAGYDVHGSVHETDLSDIDGFSAVHRADLCDSCETRRLIEAVKPHHVVHLAAVALVSHSDVDAMYRSNIIGARHLLGALAGLDQRPDSILLASSANIYGNAQAGTLDECARAAPANDYGVTKLSMEQVASIYRQGLPIIIARPFNYTGRGQSPQFIIPKIVQHIRDRSPTIELGNLDVARDFSDVRTVVDAYARLLFAPSAVGQVFNVCSGRAISLSEILDIAGRLSGHQLVVKVNPDLVRANEVLTLCGSKAKIESVLGPLLAIPFEETLLWMIDA